MILREAIGFICKANSAFTSLQNSNYITDMFEEEFPQDLFTAHTQEGETNTFHYCSPHVIPISILIGEDDITCVNGLHGNRYSNTNRVDITSIIDRQTKRETNRQTW